MGAYKAGEANTIHGIEQLCVLIYHIQMHRREHERPGSSGRRTRTDQLSRDAEMLLDGIPDSDVRQHKDRTATGELHGNSKRLRTTATGSTES